MKRQKQVLAILMTVTMILTGTSLDGFGALSFAADDEDVTSAGQELQEESFDGAEAAQDEAAAPDSNDTELVHKTLKANKVKLDGMMPEGAEVTATDASSAKAVQKLNKEDGTTLAAYDITIEADGEEYQPDSDNPIQVQISDKAIKEDSDLTIWHIRDDGTKEEIEDFAISEGKVTFDATGFSVYVIVEGPKPLDPPKMVKNQDEFNNNYDDADGFFLSYGNPPMYFENTVKSGGVYEETGEITAAAAWFFEKVAGQNQYRIYTEENGAIKYMYNTTGNEMGLTTDSAQASAFEISNDVDYKFLIKLAGAKKWLQHSGSGQGIRLWSDTNNVANSRISMTYVSSAEEMPDDPYGLDGKSYGIINYRGGTEATALLAKTKSNNNYRMDAKSVQVRIDPIKKSSGNLVIAKDEEIPFWTFSKLSKDIYTLSTKDNGTTKYLRIEGDSATVTTSPDAYCEFKVVPCDGENTGKIRIVGSNGYELNNNGGKASNGFYGRSGYTGPDSRMTLIAPSDVYDDNDFVDYTAKKVSVSDTEKVYNGQTVVVYTRIWNEEKKKYDFYAIDHEGDLVYCYETGDHIMWTGARVNTMLWQFTEYYYEGTTDPNFYYELQNTYSGKYIAPKISGGIQTLSDNTIGINLEGRRNGEYSSNIVAWDDPQYDYAGLAVKPNSLELTAEPLADAGVFYFAIMDETQGTLTPVNTVDHEAAAGLTMKMVDFDNTIHPPEGSGSETSVEQWEVMGEQTFTENNTHPGLLSTDVKDDGYPEATITNTSFGQLFTGDKVKQVNHLFLKDTYEESGYFVYDSSQNFAHLDKNEDKFTVYKELGTTDIPSHNDTLAHGQFMPYNNLDVPNQATRHPENVTDITAKPLPDDNPRKGETLYRYTEDPDHFFGMEINGNMMQTPSGKDKWGHDIIFEFTGDDDFWLYVDDLLVLDIGGIHKALSGSVNYSTGEVVVNGKHTTLREMFKSSYEDSHPGASSAEVEAFLNSKFRLRNGNYVFKDYSLHSIKIFFMERGAGASNLRMRFNLSPVKPGTVLLSKEITGTDKDRYAGVKFPFQIYYKTEDDEEYQRLKDSGESTPVKYQDTEEPVPYKDSDEIKGVAYNDLYYLKPEETAEIVFPDDTIDYYIVECGVDSAIFDEVELNGGVEADPDNELDVISHDQGINDYKTCEASTNERSKAIFTNHAKAENLHNIIVKKNLVDQNGTVVQNDDTGFLFRMYLGPNEDPDYYRLGAYYVKDPSGNYCRYDSTTEKFASLGKTDFSQLTPAEKKQAKFTTSPSGAIDKIPNGYSFEIRDVLIGTDYKVEEKNGDLPKGYTFKEFTEGENKGEVKENSPANITIEAVNEKGLGLTAKKDWSDADSTDYHEDIYLAVYDDNNLLVVDRPDLGIDGQKYIKRIRTKTSSSKPTPDKSAYFFIPAAAGKTFSDYSVKEVKLTGTVHVNEETGFVIDYGGRVTPVADGDSTEIEATADGDSRTYNYTVTYKTGTVPSGENTRTDTVTNTREGGIAFIKKDMDGSPLADAEFTLKQGDANVGDETYVSDSNGVITTMYGYEEGVDYTLTETAAPKGYTGIPAAVTIRIEDGQVSASGEGLEDYIVVDQGGVGKIPSVTIKNRKSEFIVKKVDQAGNPLAGARFSLSRQIKDSKTGEYRKDYYPLSNYEELPADTGTEADGVVITAAKTANLGAGSYYLTETETPSGYEGLSKDLLFNISTNGEITVTTEDYSSYLKSSGEGTGDDPLVYELNVENISTTPIAPTRYSSYILPFLLILIGGLLLAGTLYFRRRRGFEE